MAAEYPGAIWAAIPGFGFPTGTHGQNKPGWIILHGTASGDGTAAEQVRFFQGNNQHGVHFVIGKDGQVVQMVALADAAYGNCCIDPPKHDAFWDEVLKTFSNLNCCTISIEHCKESANNSDILTSEQQAASFALVAWLCKHLNIPARPADVHGGITGHFSMNGINRANCPGWYPWNALWSFLGGAMVPQGPFVWPKVGTPGGPPSGTTFRQVINSFGLADADFLALNSWAQGYNLELAIADGTEVKLPGYAQPVPPDLASYQAYVDAVEKALLTFPKPPA